MATTDSPYGFCPVCYRHGVLTRGKNRERRPFGNDICERGHTYPSLDAIGEKSPHLLDRYKARYTTKERA